MLSAKILLILIVGLIVFGPKHLPHLAEILGRLFSKAQRLTAQIQATFNPASEDKKTSDTPTKSDDNHG